MNNKLQILDVVEMVTGLFLGMSAKLLEVVSTGDIKTLFAVINICSLLLFVQGILNILEDKYGIKLINLNNINTKPVMYKSTSKALR